MAKNPTKDRFGSEHMKGGENNGKDQVEENRRKKEAILQDSCCGQQVSP